MKALGLMPQGGCCPCTVGHTREGTERDEARTGDRFLQAVLGSLDLTFHMQRPFCEAEEERREPSLCVLRVRLCANPLRRDSIMKQEDTVN